MLYTAPVARILREHHLNYHMYADDTQIYNMCLEGNLGSMFSVYEQCISDIKEWMDRNKLKLNSDKTEALLVVSAKKRKEGMAEQHLCIEGSNIPLASIVKNLGVVLDSELSMKGYINQIRKNTMYTLKNIRTIRPFLTQEACCKLVLSLIFSRLDYCNSLFFGLSKGKLEPLQKVQNSVARLVLQKRRCDEAMPLLKDLHWLPMVQRVQYKAATVVYTCLHGTAPKYAQELIREYQPGRCLRSTQNNAFPLDIPRCRVIAGERSFQHFGPRVWNSLPNDVKLSQSIDTFKKRLKTVLYRQAFNC